MIRNDVSDSAEDDDGDCEEREDEDDDIIRGEGCLAWVRLEDRNAEAEAVGADIKVTPGLSMVVLVDLQVAIRRGRI